jgi:hypothetical protein
MMSLDVIRAERLRAAFVAARNETCRQASSPDESRRFPHK